jgi:hypothetical protein
MTFIEKQEPSVNAGVLKAVLEVNVGEGVITENYPTKPDKKGTKAVKTSKILLCNLKNECKIYEIKTGVDEDEEGANKKLKPFIVTDFDEDPLKGNEDDSGQNTGKKSPKVPVIVGYKGAVKDDGFSYTGPAYGQGIDRLPAYYGMKLSPGFLQPSPGPVLYADDRSPLTRPAFSHGSYPTYGNLCCFYPYYEGQQDPVLDARGYYSGISPSIHTYFSGHAPRTPSPYGHVHPTSRPGIIMSLGTTWPTVQWPQSKPSAAPEVVAVAGKTNFEEEELSVGEVGPLQPDPGNGKVKIDGKLGEPLNVSDS